MTLFLGLGVAGYHPGHPGRVPPPPSRSGRGAGGRGPRRHPGRSAVALFRSKWWTIGYALAGRGVRDARWCAHARGDVTSCRPCSLAGARGARRGGRALLRVRTGAAFASGSGSCSPRWGLAMLAVTGERGEREQSPTAGDARARTRRRSAAGGERPARARPASTACASDIAASVTHQHAWQHTTDGERVADHPPLRARAGAAARRG